ncbi:hypothetical protein F5888DRAFT_782178 [Russula emetica]|nr:hypothetical protein F5888DRAFT_782178 [Russula emetica]
MVDYHDPIILMQVQAALVKLWHAVAGLYFWELVTTLDYEWSVIRGHRPYRWLIWVYSTTRIATAISLAMSLYIINVSTPYNCQVVTVIQFLSGYLSIASSSLLIVLRIFAIWNKKKIIVAIATGVLGINVVFLIQGLVRIRAIWNPLMSICMVVNNHIPELNIFGTLVTDISLLLIMSFGLLRQGFHERSVSGLGHLLWKQGLIWLLVATIAEVLPAVFLSLNLNYPLNYMFLPLSVVTLSIASTRIHRGLVDHGSTMRTEKLSDPISLQGSGRTEWKHWKIKSVPTTAPTLPTHMEYSSLTSVEGQSCERPTRQPGLDDNTENDVGSSHDIKLMILGDSRAPGEEAEPR